MRVLKKILRSFGYLLAGIAAFVLSYLAITWLLFYLPVNRNAAQEGLKEMSIYIMSNGVHTDIVVPVKTEIIDWSTIARFEDTESKDTTFQYIAFGWGDKGFYLETPQWSDLKFSTAFNAAFHLGSTAMHTDFCRTVIPGKHCKEIRISKAQYEKLVQYIKSSFKYDQNGHVIRIETHDDGYGPDDAFYEAEGAYDLFNTCNTWANSALKACEQKACWWTPTDKGIFHQYPYSGR